MPRHIFAEKRAYRRVEAPVERTETEVKQDQERQQKIKQEIADIDATTDALLEDIDEILAVYDLGHAATAAAYAA